MLTWILIVLAAPSLITFVLFFIPLFKLFPRLEAYGDWIRSLRQHPEWISYVMGHPRPTGMDRVRVWLRSALYWWLTWIGCVMGLSLRRVWSWICGAMGHRFDKTYGNLVLGTKPHESGGYEMILGDPCHYCSRCYKWRDSRGFME